MSKKSLSFCVLCAVFGLYMFIPIRWGIGGAHMPSLLLLIAFGMCVLHERKIHLPKEIRSISMLLYFGGYTLLFFKDNGWGMGLNFLLEQFLPIYLCAVYVNSEKKLLTVLKCFSYAMFVYSCLGILEALTKFNLFDALVGFVYESQDQMMRFGIYRPRGVCTMTINNCVVLSFALCIVAYYMSIKKKVTLFDKITYILIVINAIFTLSRAAMLMLFAIQLFVGWRTGYIKNKYRVLGVGVLFIMALLFVELLNLDIVKNVVEQFLLMFTSVFSKSAAASLSSTFGANPNGIGHRFMLFEWVIEDVGTNKLFGLGAKAGFARYVTMKTIKTSIENYYLSRYFHFGFAGLTISGIAIAAVIRYIAVHCKQKVSFEKKLNINEMVLVAFLMYLVILLTVSTTDDIRLFSLLLGVTIARNKIGKKQKE